MKIAYVSWAEVPSTKANSVHIMKMCQALSNCGIDVTLYCIDGDKDVSDTQVFVKYGVSRPFRLYRIRIPWIVRKIPLAKELFSACITYFRIRNDNYDNLYGRSWIGLYLLRNRYKFIFESHMLVPFITGGGFIMRALVKHKNMLRLVVISDALKSDSLREYHWLTSDNIVVLHDGADMPNNVKTEKVELSINGEPVIGYVGHLYPGKCMEVLMEIAKKCNYRFHIVGGTEKWLAHWKHELANNQIDSFVFHGYIDNSELHKYYNAFDICIMPFSSKIFFYGGNVDIGKWTSPLKLFEAMAYSKAIISSDLSTIREVMNNGTDCILVQANDIDEWIVQLNMLVGDKKLQQELGEAAHVKLARLYTWNVRAQAVKSMFTAQHLKRRHTREE